MFLTGGYNDYKASIIKMGTKNPLSAHATDMGLSVDLSIYEEVTLHLQVDPEKWARRANVKEAWHKLRDKYDLDHDAWDYATGLPYFRLRQKLGLRGQYDQGPKVWLDRVHRHLRGTGSGLWDPGKGKDSTTSGTVEK
ncbi:hypothetical protein MPDQ_001998 [Monascus purpureus]|uniref:Uncharacterized protein n=1 Tax=Monascus purpureus TaxID=5098 RepID=A0A507R547_MONPU|nr:hypothetical protein MPDQ_001998 [Monascus purpureus]BDD56353.1 hypothetical protein MAP00_001819 [Monascus purpureus]